MDKHDTKYTIRNECIHKKYTIRNERIHKKYTTRNECIHKNYTTEMNASTRSYEQHQLRIEEELVEMVGFAASQ